MASRLPIPGSDDGTWGDILNDFLGQAHNADGSLKQLSQSQIQNLVSDLASKVDTTDSRLSDSRPATDGSVASLVSNPASSTAATLNAAYAPHGVVIEGRRRDRLPSFLVPDKQVMASPPTVGAVASASAITGGVSISPLTGGGGSSSVVDTTAPFLYLGTGGSSYMTRYGSAFPDYNYVRTTHKTTINTANAHHSVSFGFDGTTLEIKLRNVGSGSYRLRVDGQLVSAAATPWTTPAQGWLPITFSLRAPRIITIELYNTPFGGVVVGANDTVWKPARRGPRVVVLGDSYTNGTGATNGPIEGFVPTLGDLMGWQDVVESGVGSTGYLAPGSGGTVKFRDRVTNDVVNLSPDVVIICGGHNDTSYTASDLQAEATALFQAIKAAASKPLLWVAGPFFQGGAAASYTSVQSAIFAAASGVADATIDTVTYPWFTGTGHVGATTGSGNGDLYISSDSVHPTTSGHSYLARRVAEAVTGLQAL